MTSSLDTVGVKALEWDRGACRSPLGDLYKVTKLSEHVWLASWNGSEIARWNSSEADAKAAAQADFDRRIRSALAAPVTPQAGEAKAVERFSPSLMGTREDWADCIPAIDGDFVRYSDYAALAALASPQPAPHADLVERKQWTYSINYGPEGEANWANLIAPDGTHVANIRIHHAEAIAALSAVPGERDAK